MRWRACLAALTAIFAWQQAAAHPHVFIGWHVEPQVENGAIVAVKLHWRFDDLYSDLVLGTVDRDRDRKLSPPEIEALAARTLANLNFYAHFSLDGQAWQAAKTDHFTASVDGDNVIYVFTLKLPKPAKAVDASSLDPEYYIELQADKAQATAGQGFTCSAGRGEPIKTQMWGSLTPDTVSCKIK